LQAVDITDVNLR